MKRVLLTGATGFVGANLTRRLLSDGHEVHLLVRPGYNPWRIAVIQRDVRLHEAQLHDAEAVARAVGQVRPEWIFHLAAHGAYSWQADLQEMLRTNLHGTINLLSACLKTGFAAFVNTGSSSEYGFQDRAPSETDLPEPNSHYAFTKLAATQFCRHTARSERLLMPTLRLYSAYGPREDPRRLLPTLIRHGLKHELPPLVEPDVARDFIYIDDVVEAFLAAATTPTSEPGAVFNVCTGVQTTMRQVVEVARHVMNIPTEPVWGSMPNRPWDATSWVGDNRKICTQLRWRPRFSLEAGLRAMLEWIRMESQTGNASNSSGPM